MAKEIQDIVIIGTGNVSYHLAKAFTGAGLNVVQVVAHSPASARKFAGDIHVPVISAGSGKLGEADLYILAVNDDKILQAALAIKKDDRFVVHTSGTVPLEILKGVSSKSGVFYPLQTFSYGKAVDFSQVPVCIEATTDENIMLLERLARRITSTIYLLDSEKRRTVHLAAVFASNFSYHMYSVAADILKTNGIQPEILHPLILETARKAIGSAPGSAQTGPAARHDLKVIEEQLQQLQGSKLYQELYRLITDSIMSQNKDLNDEL